MSHVLEETCLGAPTFTANEYQRKRDNHPFLSDSAGPEQIVDRLAKVGLASTLEGILTTFRVA